MGGDKPLGLIIGLVVTAVLVALPAAVVPAFYLFANVYALITGGEFSSDTMNVGVFLAGLAVTVAVVLLVGAGVVVLIGRSLSPKRHRA